jgi:hypothetical protein
LLNHILWKWKCSKWFIQSEKYFSFLSHSAYINICGAHRKLIREANTHYIDIPVIWITDHIWVLLYIMLCNYFMDHCQCHGRCSPTVGATKPARTSFISLNYILCIIAAQQLVLQNLWDYHPCPKNIYYVLFFSTL